MPDVIDHCAQLVVHSYTSAVGQLGVHQGLGSQGLQGKEDKEDKEDKEGKEDKEDKEGKEGKEGT